MVFHIVIMGAQRVGVVNALATAAGVSHKCLINLQGRTLVDYVVSAAADARSAGLISLVIDDLDAARREPRVVALEQSGRLRLVQAGNNLFESVRIALETPPPADTDAVYPAIITTADNALLTAEMLDYFCNAVVAGGCDSALAMVEKSLLLTAHPDGQRRFHRFRGGEYSNCNLYALVNARALAAARAFEGGGQFAKSLIRVLKAFGLLNMLAYRFAFFSRDRAIERIGARFGVTMQAVDMPFPEAPIDVDNERTMGIADRILAERKGAVGD